MNREVLAYELMGWAGVAAVVVSLYIAHGLPLAVGVLGAVVFVYAVANQHEVSDV